MELPVLLLWQILLRLPVGSLCRFRCVSKLWRSVIADPLFVESHRGCRPELLITCSWDAFVGIIPRPEKKTPIHTELYSAAYPLQKRRTLTPAPAPQSSSLISVPGIMSHQVGGGLYCLDSGTRVRLFNPATRELFDLDTAFNPCLMKRTECNAASVRITSHFGFDPVERKHKVLTLWGPPYYDCYVFVLEGKYWTKIRRTYPREAVSVPDTGEVICLDGVIFSTPPSPTARDGQILVAFDVRREVFRVIRQLPKRRGERVGSRRKLVGFAGRAALVVIRGTRLTLWVLEDLGRQVWRRKDCVIPPWGEDSLGPLDVQGGTPAGELFLAPHIPGPSFLLIYNVGSGALRRIELQGLPRGDTSLRFHVESLCSPKAKKQASSS